MHVVIAGAGEMGRRIARALRGDGHDVVVLEHDPKVLARIGALDVLTVEGNAASPRTLERGGVGKAEFLFALTGSDETNLMACALARTRGVRTVCRVNSFDYMDTPVTEAYRPVGADLAVSVEILGAVKAARVLDAPGFSNVEILADGRLRLGELRIGAASPALDETLDRVPFPAGVRPLGHLRGDVLHFLGEGDALQEGDRVLLVARADVSLADAARPLLSLETRDRATPRRVLIVGASTVGLSLARILTSSGRMVRVLDEDPERVARASADVPAALAAIGRATERATLEEEDLANYDAIVAATESEEFNILAALLAAQLGVRRTLVSVNQPEITGLVESMGVEAAFCPRLEGVAALYRPAHPLSPNGLVLLPRGGAHVLDLTLTARTKSAGLTAARLPIPKGARVIATLRAGRVLLAGEEEGLAPGDRLLVIAREKDTHALRRVL